MKSMLFILTHAPHGSSFAREGLDAVLAASAVCDQISVLFEGDGVWQLMKGQQPQAILQRHIEPTYGMLSLYDIEHCYACKSDLEERGIAFEQMSIDLQIIDDARAADLLAQHSLIVRF
ncbi:sulfurtransferase complex subunit TusC [Celerinatantimonas diazotrophica]|uniref:tRNA 2-thiouridine synthesizing protein C n=1 Tax=Celerinatantimonas diazotrophica TaxID=412034 RepID=A0A4R1K1A9_9GAMM|nr:sulfurtransferase complex subunit TusC [Celerinatantimonas diazotrophica]TCK57670.1 tRNA 2-thiouridine synthesizing protein C [Celerinatantimonas diazotrophica]CAG9298268.1 Protein TusC [Celerinatantimonas diazotrophica]